MSRQSHTANVLAYIGIGLLIAIPVMLHNINPIKQPSSQGAPIYVPTPTPVTQNIRTQPNSKKKDLINIPIQSSFIENDRGLLVVVESLWITSGATKLVLRADNTSNDTAELWPADSFIIDDHGKRYPLIGDSNDYPYNPFVGRMGIKLGSGASLRFTYAFNRLDPGVVNIKLHRHDAVYPIHLSSDQVLGESPAAANTAPDLTNRFAGQIIGIQSLSGWRVDSVNITVEKMLINNEATIIVFRAEALQNSRVCSASKADYISDGRGDRFWLKQDLTEGYGSFGCRPLAEGEIARIVYMYERLERPHPVIEVHRDNLVFTVDILDSFPVDPTALQVELAASSCDVEPTSRSLPSSENTSIRFINRSPERRSLFWLDSNGSRSRVATLDPGEKYVHRTFAGHVWVVTNDSEVCTQIFKAREQEAKAYLY